MELTPSDSAVRRWWNQTCLEPGIPAPESVCVLMLFSVLETCLSVDLMEAIGQGVGGGGGAGHRE